MSATYAQLSARKVLLERGPLNWSDAEIDQIAGFTSLPHADLVAMRHKMGRAALWSIANLEALDDLVAASPVAATLRPQVEKGGSLAGAKTTATTFTGLFPRIKDEIALIDEAIRAIRPSLRQRLTRALRR